MKRILSTLCLTLWGCVMTYGQTDITSDYLSNPSFEADAASCTTGSSAAVSEGSEGLRGWNISPTGWTATSPGKALIISADCATDNGFGKTSIADGSYAYYQRYGWGSATSSLSQTTKAALPAGDYQLIFHTKAFCANNASTSAVVSVKNGGTKTLASLSFSCTPGSAGIMGSSTWNERTLSFSLTEDAPITISAEMIWGNGGSCIAYDHFTLTEMPSGSIKPEGSGIEGGTEDEVPSPTEGIITHRFIDEATMQQDLLQMLTDFLPYAKNIWYNCAAPNSKNEVCGYFKANSAGQSNEDGVRTNADFSMICAFLYKYAQGKTTLPTGITWNEVKEMALKSLVFGYSTHKANKFKITADNRYWGSVSNADHVWESSLWTMSLAYASHFLDSELSDTQKGYIYNMIKAECNYELERSIPTGYNGDTKAEENGWEVNVLACALGLYPNDPLAERWFDRMRAFAINSYSQVDDATNTTVIDPEYDNKTVQDYYVNKNLYDDYTLQNHNYFHTSYQNVVIQELGESQLALNLFQGENPKWSSRALMHNNQAVMDEVLCRLALADGELAMPNGNDWSMFLYDQITSYSTMACFLRDPNALMLENLAYQNIKARQSTTSDGSWLLNSDIGPRRMGVEAHRVMMTYLMHEAASTADLQPTTWDDFSKSQETAHLFTSQNIVRANTADRFSVFSWSSGLKSYTGYIASNKPDKNKIIVPYKANNTGNILGWYTISGKATDASPLVNGIYELHGNSYTMNGKLQTNGGSLENNFTLYSTPGNAFIYMDYVVGKGSGIITEEKGGLMAISTDPFTKEKRTLYHANGRMQTDGSELKRIPSPWVNIDNEIGIITSKTDNTMAFGDRELRSSVYLSKIYPVYATDGRTFAAGETVDRRHIVYYNNVDSVTTAHLAKQLIPLTDQVPEGWNGLIACDTDSARYLLLSNYLGETSCTLKNLTTPDGAPVLPVMTALGKDGATATLRCDVNHSIGATLRVYVETEALQARQIENDSCGAYLYNTGESKQNAIVTIWADGRKLQESVTVDKNECVSVKVSEGQIVCETVTPGEEETNEYVDITEKFLSNPGFEEDKTYGTESNITLNGVVYNPCYINTVTATDKKWPQILPVKGWTAGNKMESGSNFSLLYSMPYSRTMYCVSPSDVGNSASIMAAPAMDETCGTRCLSILNSWDKGSNAVTQSVTLPKGDYKLTFLAQYVCPNEMRHVGDGIISTTGDNINYSLCGVSFGNTQIFRYPRLANNWELVECPFTLTEETAVTLSMGLRTTAGVGAANNTRLYIDQVRLYSKGELPTNIGNTALSAQTGRGVDVYTLQGIKVRSNVTSAEATEGLQKGIYIVGQKKTFRN